MLGQRRDTGDPAKCARADCAPLQKATRRHSEQQEMEISVFAWEKSPGEFGDL
jgi:hypothetical protein